MIHQTYSIQLMSKLRQQLKDNGFLKLRNERCTMRGVAADITGPMDEKTYVIEIYAKDQDDYGKEEQDFIGR